MRYVLGCLYRLFEVTRYCIAVVCWCLFVALCPVIGLVAYVFGEGETKVFQRISNSASGR